MKVLFLLNGLTHYFNSVLNRINTAEDFEVIVIIPGSNKDSIGKGVYLTQEGIEFKVCSLKEKQRFYGKVFYKGFKEILESEKPNAVVFIWPYIFELVFNKSLLNYLRRQKIKILLKEIPFQIQKFKDALHFCDLNFLDENLNSSKNSIFDKFKNLIVALIRKYYYSFIDLNLHYVEDGHSILKSFGVPEEKIFVTYNSPDTDLLLSVKEKVNNAPPMLSQNDFRIIHVGRLVKWKRVDLLIRAVSMLSNKFPEVELIVVGEGPELNNLKKLSNELKVENKILFVGSVYDPYTLGRYFKCSAVYALGGMGGLSLNEAMVFEKPVICSICDGTEKKLVRENINGYYFINGDLDSLVEKLSLVLQNQKLISVFGANSLKIITNEVNINSVVGNYISAFKLLETSTSEK
jgi:glycosyltransferase involved in cell wall biosynthesis